jgi:hypothetical protein
MMSWRGYQGIEVKNREVNTEGIWFDLLDMHARAPFAFASDDCHYAPDRMAGNSIYVFADSLTVDDIMASIREGNFYATEGPIISSISLADEKITVTTPDPSRIDFIIHGQTSPGTVHHATSASYRPRPSDRYVRIMVLRDRDSKYAWANPIWIRETVKVWNSENGVITSNPSGIDCGKTCTATFPYGSAVTLTATPSGSGSFLGWYLACTGTDGCALPMTGPAEVASLFTPCPYTVSAHPALFPATTGSYAIDVRATGGQGVVCGAPANPVVDSPWITANYFAWRNNRGKVDVRLSANSSSLPRTGNVVVADKVVQIAQKGTPCTIGNLTPPSPHVAVAGGPFTLGVEVSPSDCTWTATSNKDWIQVSSGAGSGTGTVSYTVSANGTGANRSGAITIILGGKRKVYTVMQSGK